MSVSKEQAQSFAVPTPFVVVRNPLTDSEPVSFPQQKYAENQKETSPTHDSTLQRMMWCIAEMAHINRTAQAAPRNSALTLEMLQQCDALRHLLESYLNDFLTSQSAGLRTLTLEEVSAFLRAEGDCYNERGEYVQAAIH